MPSTNIGISDAHRKNSAKILNNVLSDVFVLYTKTLCCHWNVQASDFRDLHLLLEDQYRTLAGEIDMIAERARALGERSTGSMAGFHEHTRIHEFDEHKDLPDAKGMLGQLLEDHETVIRELREQHGNVSDRQHDIGTTSLFEDLLVTHEKMAWFLRSHL
ncbi:MULTISPECIES: Dps family protein [Halomonadaceae]|uniref:DNA starvation/stationary phase protection protein n=1 Tax=Vreelandella venusta TaxID=44935 RepID=A0ABX2BC10_9GAMM|nr:MULTISPECIES: DNA starvation/stationary phase protection protein [Halomonas]AZM96525.1 DNA starvation/stationary phase protection protein [Halomonas venusta]NPT30165.1 DNA starvation/stationary phase protection protein [Halomonas venusta]WKD27141.1 DNA starvation/stationary phase protection protein [Halomonas sp. KG2]